MRRAFFSFANYRWVPWAIAGALLVVASVNGALAYFALHSDPGLVAEHPFELGNGYNRVLDAGAAQDALGWHGAVRFVREEGLSGRVVVELHDSSNTPVRDLVVKAVVMRPVEPLPEQTLVLDAAGQGRYEAPVTLARAGQWDVQVTAARGAEIYQFVRRIVVQ